MIFTLLKRIEALGPDTPARSIRDDIESPAFLGTRKVNYT